MHAADVNDPKVAAVVAAAAAAGVVIRPVSFDNDTRTSVDAAREIGCEVDYICKSLVFQSEGEPVLLLMSGSDRVDLTKAAAMVGVARLERANADLVKRRTGYSIGATPPFGHREPLRAYIDERLAGLGDVWAAGGRPDTVFEISAPDLIAASGAQSADLRDA